MGDRGLLLSVAQGFGVGRGEELETNSLKTAKKKKRKHLEITRERIFIFILTVRSWKFNTGPVDHTSSTVQPALLAKLAGHSEDCGSRKGCIECISVYKNYWCGVRSVGLTPLGNQEGLGPRPGGRDDRSIVGQRSFVGGVCVGQRKTFRF